MESTIFLELRWFDSHLVKLPRERNTCSVLRRYLHMSSSAAVPNLRRLLTIAIALTLVAAACSSAVVEEAVPAETTPTSPTSDGSVDTASQNFSAESNLGPTNDELNTIAVAELFGESTAALAVEVGGEQMLPDGQDGLSSPPDDVLPRVDLPTRRSSGSGFLIDIQGRRYVVTNFHVVQATLEVGTSEMRADSSVVATFGTNDRDRFSLQVVGVNPSFDLALLQPAPDGPALPNLPPIPIGDSDLVVKGQKTIALGNPFGLGSTLTTGTVSSTGRLVTSVGQVSVPMIQTDAAINPGNSGGALLNSSGELIGINTSIFNPASEAFAGIGFAVPSNLLVEALANLELGGVSTVSDTRPNFGARLGTLGLLPDEVREEAGLPATGAAVLDVFEGGPADDAGLVSPEVEQVMGIFVPVDPDIIVAIDGEPVETAEDLNLAITYDADLGQEVVLTILRGGVEIEVPVLLG